VGCGVGVDDFATCQNNLKVDNIGAGKALAVDEVRKSIYNSMLAY
jgi:hypothetical protein